MLHCFVMVQSQCHLEDTTDNERTGEVALSATGLSSVSFCTRTHRNQPLGNKHVSNASRIGMLRARSDFATMCSLASFLLAIQAKIHSVREPMNFTQKQSLRSQLAATNQ